MCNFRVTNDEGNSLPTVVLMPITRFQFYQTTKKKKNEKDGGKKLPTFCA